MQSVVKTMELRSRSVDNNLANPDVRNSGNSPVKKQDTNLAEASHQSENALSQTYAKTQTISGSDIDVGEDTCIDLASGQREQAKSATMLRSGAPNSSQRGRAKSIQDEFSFQPRSRINPWDRNFSGDYLNPLGSGYHGNYLQAGNSHQRDETCVRPRDYSGRNYMRGDGNYGQSQTRHSPMASAEHSAHTGDAFHMNAPKLRLPYFNGKSEWKSFLVQFNLMSRKFGWSRDHQCEQLIFCLQDEPLSFVAQLPEHVRTDFDLLVTAMERRFGDHVLAQTYRATLQTIRKDTRESLSEYASRVSVAMSKAYPGLYGSQLFTDLTIEHLVQGLNDPNMAYDVLTKKPQSVEDALDMIAWHECCKNSSRKRGAVRQMHFDDSEIMTEEHESDIDIRRVNGRRFVTEERLNQFGRDLKETLVSSISETIMDQIKTTFKNFDKPKFGNHGKFPRSGSEITCYSCGLVGHISRDCPKKSHDKSSVSDKKSSPKSSEN